MRHANLIRLARYLAQVVDAPAARRPHFAAAGYLVQRIARGGISWDELTAALHDRDIMVRRAAAEALRPTHPTALPGIVGEMMSILRGERVPAFLEPLRLVPAILGTQELDSPAPAIAVWLSEMMDTQYWEVRMRAALALGTLGQPLPTAVMQKLRVLQADADSSSVRLAVTKACE